MRDRLWRALYAILLIAILAWLVPHLLHLLGLPVPAALPADAPAPATEG